MSKMKDVRARGLSTRDLLAAPARASLTMRADGELVYGPPPLPSSRAARPRSAPASREASANASMPERRPVEVAPPPLPKTGADLTRDEPIDLSIEPPEHTARTAAPIEPNAARRVEPKAAAPASADVDIEIDAEAEIHRAPVAPMQFGRAQAPDPFVNPGGGASPARPIAAPITPTPTREIVPATAYDIEVASVDITRHPPPVGAARAIIVRSEEPRVTPVGPRSTDVVPTRPSVNLRQRRIRERSRTDDFDSSFIHDARAKLLYEEAAKAVARRDLVTAERHLALALSYMPEEPRFVDARDKVRRLRGKLGPR